MDQEGKHFFLNAEFQEFTPTPIHFGLKSIFIELIHGFL